MAFQQTVLNAMRYVLPVVTLRRYSAKIVRLYETNKSISGVLLQAASYTIIIVGMGDGFFLRNSSFPSQ